MKREQGKYFKASLLLLVFSLNTVVSFACSVTSLFHNWHHAAQHEVSAHVHNKAAVPGKHAPIDVHHQHDSESSSNWDDCCSKTVVELDKVEKTVSKTITIPVLVFQDHAYTDLSLLQSFSPKISAPAALKFRWRVAATIPDRRVVFQSFQI